MSPAKQLIDTSVYAYSSRIIGNEIRLCRAQKETGDHPYFKGQLIHPLEAARFLLTLSKVVRTRFHTPPAMLHKILLESDPVITCNGNELLFEGFSACCSTYANVRMNPSAFENPDCGNGTTNVDFGESMRTALARIRTNDELSLEVGTKGVKIDGSKGQVIERKIPLPYRWIKSFNAVQSYMAEMKPFAELTRADALRFIRSIPKQPSPRAAYQLTRTGRGLRLSQIQTPNSISIKAIERLRLLEDLIPLCSSMKIFANTDQSASCWILRTENLQFTICISAEAWRGFSGEGRGLGNLVKTAPNDQRTKMEASLHWEKKITADQFATTWDIKPADAARVLNEFAQRGLLGFDLAEHHYFYRRLPYDLQSIDQLQPRIKKAKQLIEKDAIDFENKDSLATAAVKDGKNIHQVYVDHNHCRCTCNWHAKHKLERGPCSHILAVQMRQEG